MPAWLRVAPAGAVAASGIGWPGAGIRWDNGAARRPWIRWRPGMAATAWPGSSGVVGSFIIEDRFQFRQMAAGDPFIGIELCRRLLGAQISGWLFLQGALLKKFLFLLVYLHGIHYHWEISFFHQSFTIFHYCNGT
ncbi:MAG: hypothetical protein AAF501_09280 [Pseudomonadota bacterium]